MYRVPALVLAMALAAAPAIAADSYTFEPKHTSVTFYYPHFGLSRPSGKIMGVTGTLVLNDGDESQDTVEATLDMTTMTTALPPFDELLKGKDYFDVARFPTAHFKSTAVELLPPDPATPDATVTQAKVTGDLTLHGITQSAVLDVTFNKKAFNPALFKTGVGFSATARLSRKAFGLGNLEPFVGDDIDLDIEAEAY